MSKSNTGKRYAPKLKEQLTETDDGTLINKKELDAKLIDLFNEYEGVYGVPKLKQELTK